MYENLIRVMAVKKIATKQIAALLDISEKTVYNKIHGKTEWTYNEIVKLKMFVFPEYDIEWLLHVCEKSA